MNSDHEVVVTGMGVVCPLGVGTDAMWQALLTQTSGVRVRPEFADSDLPLRICAPVVGFEAKQYIKPRKAMKIMCEPIKFGCAAASMAVEQAGLEATDDRTVAPERIGTVFGTETFFADPTEVADVFRKCTEGQDYQHDRWGEFAMREIQPLWMLKYLPNMAASHISIAMDARGPSNSICQGEASSLLALIEAATLIERGDADVVIAGGTGSQMALTAMLYRGVGDLSKRIHEPESASRPFSSDRDGMVVGEGAGALVLESRQHAESRGARVIARLVGSSRGYALAGDDTFSTAFESCLKECLQRADWSPEQVGVVNANANGCVAGDAAEAKVLNRVLGDVPVMAPKANFGNLGPGTSIVELVAGLLALDNGTIPASPNRNPSSADCPVCVVSENVAMKVRSLLKTSISATGQFAAVAFEN